MSNATTIAPFTIFTPWTISTSATGGLGKYYYVLKYMATPAMQEIG